MSTPTVSVIVVSFDSAVWLTTCLDSVARDLQDEEWEAVVIENATTSLDVTRALAVSHPRRVRVIQNDHNVGFACAVNQGLAATRGALVWILNPDCAVLPGAFTALRAQALEDGCGIVGPRVLNLDRSVQGSARGDPTMLTGLFGRSTLLTRLFPHSPVVQKNIRTCQPIPAQAVVEVDWLSAACLVGRRKVLEEVGGFDEGYFLYWEDADLCRRIRHRGYSVRYVSDATVIHAQGRSTRKVPRLAIRSFHESAYRYYATHVARWPFGPGRLIARVALGLRCRWKLWRVVRRSDRVASGDSRPALDLIRPFAGRPRWQPADGPDTSGPTASQSQSSA
jgi:N-acetylglucosaminyl-diphospho-decaprenol L-rhamnosyltransferase